jgi:hypothetical protein
MKGRMLALLILCCLSIVVGGDAKSPDNTDKPVWTLEFIKVSPEKYGPTLGHLDQQWMRIREEAKRQGIVTSYHRISDAGLVMPDHKPEDQTSIVLLTEYRNMAAFLEREKTFASIREHLPSSTPGVLRPEREDVYKTMDGHLFAEVPAEGNAEFKLLAKQ